MINKPGPYEIELKELLKKKECIGFHASIVPGVSTEDACKEILEMEAAFERGEFEDVTNKVL